MPHYQFVVLSNPTEGREDEYNAWYDGDHLRDVLAVPGVTGARRSRLVQSREPLPHRYMAIYDIESDDVQSVLADIAGRSDTERMPMSPAIDRTTIFTSLYELRPDSQL